MSCQVIGCCALCIAGRSTAGCMVSRHTQADVTDRLSIHHTLEGEETTWLSQRNINCLYQKDSAITSHQITDQYLQETLQRASTQVLL